ncbi:GerMN domain-containing protein [Phycicoccus sonneratiae]|uniref:GerMN domain-containing protein n=1 Tax=Phycicoccus sonneratiae TaxID=2807628 RepID=A0ABS2CR58_9MICO|nr:GerMN domain-containing protein [Phycicoccus sonneraticus]MBM6402361.1 GerMN domain-containing protein [Phycicoccus sonneraticus]
MTAGRWTVGASVLLVAAALAGCGAPHDTPASTIASVPYDLLAPSDAAAPSPTESATRGPFVFLVREDRLVPASPVADPGSSRDAVGQALRLLVEGPTEADRAAGRSTALGPDVQATLTSLEGGRATVDLRAGSLPTGAGRLPLAAGQLVLTLTSVPGVDDVVLTSDGSPIEAPLPGGALTDRPLTAQDYATLLASSASDG